MKAVNIKLSLAENVKYFVNIANKYPYDIDLRVGRHVVDGKSILGIFSLDLSKPITLRAYTDDAEEMLAVIATRSERSHITLFFVSEAHMRKGIGKALFRFL